MRMTLIRQQIGIAAVPQMRRIQTGCTFNSPRLQRVPQPDVHLLQQYKLPVPGAQELWGFLLSHVNHNRLSEPILRTHPIMVPEELQKTQA